MEKALTSTIAGLVAEGVFGKASYKELKSHSGAVLGAQFASDLAFVDLFLEGPSGEEVLPLVVKVQIEDPYLREQFDLASQFHNELTMYKVILPALGADQQWYPKLYYGSVIEGKGEDDILVLENLNNKNFRISKEKIFLDYDHISLAMKRIASFHALSYILKHKNLKAFKELTEKLKHPTMPRETELRVDEGNFAAVKRGVKAFEKINADNENLEFFLKIVKNVQVVRDILSLPEEPFDVFCHGDYCKNNVLYKYDESGRPIDCAFFDFQMSGYGSLGKDIVFFLYMHTTAETRDKYWDDFIKIYWETLRENVPKHIGVPEFHDFLKHIASRAVFGYLICSFFIPALIEDVPKDFDWLRSSREEQIEMNTTIGGAEAEEIIRDIVSHLFKRRYLHAFLDFAKTKHMVR